MKTNGDSLACLIDSIKDTKIYFEMKFRNNWSHTEIKTSDYIEYKLNAINKNLVSFRPGTS